MSMSAKPRRNPTGPLMRRQLVPLLGLEWKLARRLLVLRVALALVPVVLVIFLRRTMDFLVELDTVGPKSAGDLSNPGLVFSAPGMAILMCYANLQFFCWSAYDEHGFSTWDRLRAGLTRPITILTAKAAFMTGYLIAMFTATFWVCWAIDMRPQGSLAGWALAACVTSAVAAVYGVMLYVLLPTGNMFIIASHAGSLVMAGFAGAIVPTRVLPGWIRAIAPYFPHYWAIRAFESVSLHKGGFKSVLEPLLVMICFGLAFASIAVWQFDPDALKRPLSE